MSQSTSRRWLVLGGLLLATVVASVWPRGEESRGLEVVAPTARSSEAASGREQTSSAPAGLPPLGERLERPKGAAKVENLFAPTTRTPAKLAASTPSAPPFPYAIAGNLVDNGVMTVIFAKQNQYFVLGVGEILENTYRIDAINSSSIAVTYLPLGHQQILPLGTLN